ncbi:MAG TPA: peptidoglycan DD-metalloendopeptidase family protein [Alphaproteobacteria bacterium]
MVPLLCAAVLGPLSLASCARIGGPAPIVAYGGSGLSAQSQVSPSRSALTPLPPQPVDSLPGEIVVQSGDTLYSIARRSNAPMRALIDANNLQPPYILQGGRRLTVPRVRAYQVQPGDTLSSVARRYGLGTTELVRANALPPPYNLRTGQVLVLPPGPPSPSLATAAPAQVVVLSPARPPESASPGTAPIVRDETLPLLTPPASPVRGSAIETTALPPPPAPAPLPALAPVPPDRLPAAAPPVTASAAAATSAGVPLPLPRPPAPHPVVPQPASLGTPPPPPPAPAEIEPVRSGRFLWPVRGTIVSDFGGKPGGLQNDGINIAAPRGTAIRAAEGGMVVYAGNELRGFGNLLLVKHRDGWITAYAHAEELLVRRGDEVRRGQVIARVGATGSVGSPQLHFEVRKGSRPLNPHDYLGPQTAAALP